MKVRILRSLGTAWGVALAEGDESDIDAGIAERLCQRGLAVSLEPELAPIKAVPAAPEITTEAVTQIDEIKAEPATAEQATEAEPAPGTTAEPESPEQQNQPVNSRKRR